MTVESHTPARAIPGAQPGGPVLRMRDATLAYGPRTIWQGLSFDVAPGEFVAVLGPNGSGKTSLVKVLLGRQELTSGEVLVGGRRPRGGDRSVGLIPQHASASAGDLRARDLVRLGVDGHRWGLRGGGRAVRERTDALLAAVGATAYADVPVRLLSGGERQRLRVAQALAGEPSVLLCDEPLASLDLAHQQGVTALVDAQRRGGTAVLFVTHDINPVLPYVDRVLYLARGSHALGSAAEVLTSECLTHLYGTPVEVVRTARGVAVLGANGADGEHCC